MIHRVWATLGVLVLIVVALGVVLGRSGAAVATDRSAPAFELDEEPPRSPPEPVTNPERSGLRAIGLQASAKRGDSLEQAERDLSRPSTQDDG